MHRIDRTSRGERGARTEDGGHRDTEANLLTLTRSTGCLQGCTGMGILGGNGQRDRDCPQDRHRREDREPLTKLADHPTEGSREAKRDHQK